MSDSMLSRQAGPIALVAGCLLAVTDLARLPIALTDDRVAILLDPAVRAFNAGYFFAFCGLVLALIALHGRQAREAGRFGVLATCLAIVGTMAMAGDMWFDAFAAPWLAEVAPQALTAERTPILMFGAVLSFGLLASGWALFGAAALRAGVFPAAFSIAIVVSGLISFQAGFPPFGVPLGLVVAALGGWLIRSDRNARRTALPAAYSGASAPRVG